MTAKKIVLRTLWHAGLYLQDSLRTCRTMQQIQPIEVAMLIIANAYNEVLEYGIPRQ